MKKDLLILGLIFLGAFGAWAEPSPSLLQGSMSKQTLYVTHLESSDLIGQVGHDTLVKIQLKPHSIAFGHYIVSLAEVISGPPGPQADILTGYPTIRVTPYVAGDYQIQVRVNLIIKTSCGGAEAITLLKQRVHLVVASTNK